MSRVNKALDLLNIGENFTLGDLQVLTMFSYKP